MKRTTTPSGSNAAFGNVFQGRKVLVTGHTGFKGAWLCEWLLSLGAKVAGMSLPPPTKPSLFEQLGLAGRLRHIEGDIREAQSVQHVVEEIQPDFIFHLAAQALVRESYQIPIETYATNVMGTIHVLDAARALKHNCAVVCITTDKCYENREWVHGYREEDPLGGYDPYSSSKAATEIAISAWRRSFFNGHSVKVASARAGNVIGGGDWAKDRIVPDCIRALEQGQSIPVRNKIATRPWQHVLEPLSGYLWLGALMYQPSLGHFDASHYTSAFNFGPNSDSNRTVAELVQEVLKHWPGRWEDQSDPHAVHEAKLLHLTTDKARTFLGWKPVWGFDDTIENTVSWYRRMSSNPASAVCRKLTQSQILAYTQGASQVGVAWAAPKNNLRPEGKRASAH